MKKNYFLSEREGLSLALEQLLHYNVWSATSLNESVYEEEALLKYLNADNGDPIKQEYENIICAAVNRAVYSKNYIPQELKKEFSKKCQRQHLDNLRMAIITYREAVKGMSRREAQARAKENKMARRVSIVDSTIKWGIRKSAKAGASAGVGLLVTALAPTVTIPGWLIGLGTYTIISLLPNKVKEPVRKYVTNAVDTVAMTAKNIAGDLAKHAVNIGQKAINTVEKIERGAKQMWEDTKVVAKQAWEETKVVAKQAWENAKKGAKKIGNKIKNFFGF
jgi:hypothetical protein